MSSEVFEVFLTDFDAVLSDLVTFSYYASTSVRDAGLFIANNPLVLTFVVISLVGLGIGLIRRVIS